MGSREASQANGITTRPAPVLRALKGRLEAYSPSCHDLPPVRMPLNRIAACQLSLGSIRDHGGRFLITRGGPSDENLRVRNHGVKTFFTPVENACIESSFYRSPQKLKVLEPERLSGSVRRELGAPLHDTGRACCSRQKEGFL